MALRLKNTSEIAKVFGVTDIGAFANNEAIKNNPQIIQLLLEKRARKQIKKKQSKFEKDYYKKLLVRSEEIQTERLRVVQSKKMLSTQVVNNKTQPQVQINNVLNANNNIFDKKNSIIQDRESVISQFSRDTELLPVLYWESEKGRYYHVAVEKNLFCGYSLIKSWGGIRNRLGNYQTRFYDTLEDALKTIKLIMKQRQYKKYKLIECLNSPH